MHYRIKELISVMRKLQQSSEKMPKPKLIPESVKEGLRLSKSVCSDQPFVFATPWMKNLLVACGDVTQTQDPKTGEWKTEKLPSGKDSRAVALVNEWVDACLHKFNGPKRDSYDESKPVGDVDHYNTDCWLGWKPKVWDIQPGQAKQREEVFDEYSKPTPGPDTEDLIRLLERDPVFQKAVLIVMDTLPVVRASREVTKISDPFMSKGTGVSYPDFKNDRTMVKGENITYGEYEIQLTKAAAAKGITSLLRFGYDWNVYTGYPRNQRGKGRGLEAQSRRTNLVVNLVNSVEMDLWKNSPALQVPFLPEDGIKAALVKMAEWIEQHKGYCGRNEDTSGWDRSVTSGWVTLSGAMRYLNSADDYTRKLVELRHNCAKRSYLLNGPKGKMTPMYGRTPSGYDDTTLLNSSVHRILALYSLMKQSPKYTAEVVYPTDSCNMYIVGDDIVAIFPEGEAVSKGFRKQYKDLNFTIHDDEKSIFGVMFIQYRVFRHPKTHEWVMSYNWPRVYRSMLSKETAKQLGRGGWTLSAYQQLGKCAEYEDVAIPLNLIAACDQYHLSLDTPVSELKKMVEEEDKARFKREADKGNGKEARVLSTAERLSNNPTLPGYKEVDGRTEVDWDYFEALQQTLRKHYDPEFLPKLGFQNPDLSKVH